MSNTLHTWDTNASVVSPEQQQVSSPNSFVSDPSEVSPVGASPNKPTGTTLVQSISGAAEAPRVRQWPTGPSKLTDHTLFSILADITDYFLVVTPLLFVALGIIAIVLNQKPVEQVRDFGKKVEAANELGPTVFPILFAAVASRALRMIAMFLAQRGTKLGELELLYGSQSVWSTFQNQFFMRRMTILGVYLLFLWCLSPLGGQASLRVVQRADKEVVSSTPVRYLHTGYASWNMSYFYRHSRPYMGASLYTSTLLASNEMRMAPRDNWGNTRVPRLEMLDSSSREAGGWMKVPPITAPEQYASLLGIPTVGLPMDSNGTYNMEASYFSLKCAPWLEMRLAECSNCPEYTNWTSYLGQVWNPQGEKNITWFGNNMTASTPTIEPYGKAEIATWFLDTPMPMDQPDRSLSGDASPEGAEFRHIHFGSMTFPSPDVNGSFMHVADCSVGEIHVEVEIRCLQNKNCSAVRMRLSDDDRRPAAITPLESHYITEKIFKELPFSVRKGENPSSVTEIFLNDTMLPHTGYSSGFTRPRINLSKVPPDVFANRLSLILNTYYQASLALDDFTGNLSPDLAAYEPGFNYTAWKTNPSPKNVLPNITAVPFISRSTEARLSRNVLIYRCDFRWLTALLLSSIILLLTGVVGLVVKNYTLVPDMLGYITSLTYDSPYLPVPKTGTILDGMDRARALQDMRVILGDVAGEREVGHLAFAAGTEVRKLDKGRLYL